VSDGAEFGHAVELRTGVRQNFRVAPALRRQNLSVGGAGGAQEAFAYREEGRGPLVGVPE
jgi:hypothetical protein